MRTSAATCDQTPQFFRTACIHTGAGNVLGRCYQCAWKWRVRTRVLECWEPAEVPKDFSQLQPDGGRSLTSTRIWVLPRSQHKLLIIRRMRKLGFRELSGKACGSSPGALWEERPRRRSANLPRPLMVPQKRGPGNGALLCRFTAQTWIFNSGFHGFWCAKNHISTISKITR